MRITINIDEKLLANVLEATGEKAKSKAVNAALKEYIRRKHVQELIDYWSKAKVDDYDDYSEEAEAAEKRREDFLNSLRDGAAGQSQNDVT